MDRQLLRQKVCQIISEMKTDPCVLVVFKTKRELKCQNELFLKVLLCFLLLRLFDEFLT